MTLDPRTPILVAGAQRSLRDGAPEPVEMIAAAARDAEASAGVSGLLTRVDSVRLVGMLSWRYRDPGRLVADRIGAAVRHSSYTGNGGNAPQALVNNACADIVEGRCDTVLIGGAEAWRTRMKFKAEGNRPEWTDQGDAPRALIEVPEVPMVFDGHKRIGLDRPAFVYPIFEQALRIAAGLGPDEHRRRIGELWSRFAQVALDNPHAWVRDGLTADQIVTPSPQNRMISWPYTKLMNSNNMVDQAAVLIVTSVETARALGISQDQWIFPEVGVDAHDTYDIAERSRLDASPAIRIAGEQALAAVGRGIDDVAHLDLYSCFPSAVQVAAQALGIDWTDRSRDLTVTGGLTFAGGPWNNYSTHAIASMAQRLRADPGSCGMVTANGGYLTKHSIGIYSTEPPRTRFRRIDAQPEVEKVPSVPATQQCEGRVEIESWTVAFARDGSPERAFVAVRTADGTRGFAGSTDSDVLEALVAEDLAGHGGDVAADGVLRLA